MSQIKFLFFSIFSFSSFLRILGVVILLPLMSGCSTYSNKWGCKDARGLPCEMLSEVDEKVNSGEIIEVYNTSCKGKACLNHHILPIQGKAHAKKYKMSHEDDVIISDSNEEEFTDLSIEAEVSK